MESLEQRLEKLISLKSQTEAIADQRKERQEELLSNDSIYTNFKQLEKEKSEEYEAMRLEIAALWKDLDLNGKIETGNGSVTFAYSKSYSVQDEKVFVDYCKSNNLIDKMYKLTLKATDFKKFVAEKDSEWETVEWVAIEDTVSITVSTKK